VAGIIHRPRAAEWCSSRCPWCSPDGRVWKSVDGTARMILARRKALQGAADLRLWLDWLAPRMVRLRVGGAGGVTPAGFNADGRRGGYKPLRPFIRLRTMKEASIRFRGFGLAVVADGCVMGGFDGSVRTWCVSCTRTDLVVCGEPLKKPGAAVLSLSGLVGVPTLASRLRPVGPKARSGGVVGWGKGHRAGLCARSGGDGCLTVGCQAHADIMPRSGGRVKR